ncbi:uncharacterized protein isoform X2 [Rhodnius prolixus]|uniref:uncharacterized protein isoform X2 n=1 Tax=Rhodnius prolixus TaxID=13249 RepID=UPI003D18CAEA
MVLQLCFFRMCEVLRLERLVERTPWGFRVTGGYDFGTPLSVVKVTGGSIAAHSGVKVGDIIVEINGQSTKHFIHTDAQNFIGISGNHLTLTILRGSLVTPPVTPLRGRTPSFENEDEVNTQVELNAHLLHNRLESSVNSEYQEEICNSLYEAPTVHENLGMKPVVTKTLQSHEGEDLNQDVSEIELDELLTGNEEVLDEGVLGINFKKYLPKVDFIRQSEVFKFLQNENTKKEIPEQVQLEKEPTKRFSTFLQKPKPPPPKPQGPLWHYPKAPRYLPREVNNKPEEPRRRRDSCHTVLWLFLGESGEHVVDERWGSVEEERINLSRCEMREEDSVSVTSSLATGQSGRDSRLDKHEEVVSNVQNVEISGKKLEEIQENNKEQTLETSQHAEYINGDIESKLENNKTEVISEEQSSKFISEDMNQIDKLDYKQQSEFDVKKQKNKEVFSKQIAEIQAQISALEIQAPTDLQTQLISIQKQLSKIVDVKSVQMSSNREEKVEEHSEKKEYYRDERTKVEEENKCLSEQSENYCEYIFDCEAKLNRTDSCDETQSSSERGSPINESDNEKYQDYRDESENIEEIGVNDEFIEGFKKGEYEICEAPPAHSPQTKKVPAHPITPQMRPIVLPGGRMWRQPKDACHDDFYQGILVAQAEVMVGNTGGVHFTKYVPPKFDMSQSAVYKLVHEIEDKTRANEKEKESAYYNTPIGKRHFYAASLKKPDPVGGVDLQL